ncbi:UbiA prenyltransferase [Spirochaeta thermophila DSM 6578]|uniref:UbiA prenyltransferase n=1 Tax=Winmispira thermophila (strain ATCC 700085 / DSM 6578 / Z-1203) TaxID=869211 RepID=G0GEF1_WINT7|nr:prenyltransferase [Spirochaeta thermophila]AEJ62288.1 UbiA prenyltransferase [Spirochaeta thermophila DSM 6578]
MITPYQFARIVEIRTKLVSVSSFAIGTLYAIAMVGEWEPVRLLVMFLAVFAVDMGTTAFNTFFDYWKGVDRKELNREEDKVLVHQNVPPGYALIIAVGLFLIAGILGLVLAFLVGKAFGFTSALGLLGTGALCMAVGFFYNGGPRPLSFTPFGELFAGGFLGGVLVLLSIFVQTGRITPQALLLAVPSTLLVASILTVNNTCDMEGDRVAGRLTLSILLGHHASRILVYAQGILGYLILALCGLLDILPRLTLPTAALGLTHALLTYRRMHRRGYAHATKGPSMQDILSIFLVFTLAAVVPLALRLFLPVP